MVNSKGLLKGVKKGTAKITATSKTNSKKKTSISVTVTNDVLVSKIVLNQTKITTDEFNEEEIQLKAKKILPSNADNKELEWSTSDEDVADVDEDGAITTGDIGEATITATAADKGGATATCKVTVTENKDSDEDDEISEEPEPATTAPVTQAPVATPEISVPTSGPITPSPSSVPANTPTTAPTVAPTMAPTYPPTPLTLDLEGMYNESMSEIKIESAIDQGGNACTKLDFAKVNQSAFFELDEPIDLSLYEDIEITAFVQGQLQLASFSSSLDVSADSWWETAGFSAYPFFRGSYPERLPNGSPSGENNIETLRYNISKFINSNKNADISDAKYIRIAFNTLPNTASAFSDAKYYIYSVRLIPKNYTGTI